MLDLLYWKASRQALHRRAQRAESEIARLTQELALLKAERQGWGNSWHQEFQRMCAVHNELRSIFQELARVRSYPQNAHSLHSVNDLPAPGQKSQPPGVWAHCYLTRHGGVRSYHVLSEVRVFIDECVAQKTLTPGWRRWLKWFC